MALSVRRLSRAVVRPHEPTPNGLVNLSVIDKLPDLRFDVRTLLVFKDGNETCAKIIREALSKALVPYYPLAGRLVVPQESSNEDDLHISCTGEGVWFVEAFADCTLDAEAPPPPPVPLMPHYQLKQASFDIAAHKIDQLKRQLSNSIGKPCSTFEVLTAGIWRSRTRAINLNDSSINVKLVFYANISHLLNPPAPPGFYGNSIFPVRISVSSGWLVDAPLAEVVQIIKEAKAKIPTEFNNWIHGKGCGVDPYAIPLDYTTLSISDWTKLGLKDVDFGWGCPVNVAPVEIPVEIMTIQPFGFPCLPPKPRTGIRFMTWCVEESHLPSFLHQMMNLHAGLN
ncbi:hypothetical protein Sjap_007145 [Stephania japonica]|uniref:Uncharacterized protein n=1 Tax=Stephania japonica TaxID=461633 RepID=A0AAP0JM14_9MAGN